MLNDLLLSRNNVTKNIVDIIFLCLVYNPVRRPTIDTLLNKIKEIDNHNNQYKKYIYEKKNTYTTEKPREVYIDKAYVVDKPFIADIADIEARANDNKFTYDKYTGKHIEDKFCEKNLTNRYLLDKYDNYKIDINKTESIANDSFKDQFKVNSLKSELDLFKRDTYKYEKTISKPDTTIKNEIKNYHNNDEYSTLNFRN